MFVVKKKIVTCSGIENVLWNMNDLVAQILEQGSQQVAASVLVLISDFFGIH